MPGQRKRRRAEQDARRRAADRTAPGTGHWEVLFETRDESQWDAHLRALRAGEERIDWATTRIDTLCGRLSQPTTYRLSVFVRTE
ncbi:hypothetical protein ABZ387_23175 [Streptomyces flaveolus]|uniref:hypothetical protein n=1 Tax=Streptomyces flaveolus TaxID=67297 RepID=UPI0033E3CB55